MASCRLIQNEKVDSVLQYVNLLYKKINKLEKNIL